MADTSESSSRFSDVQCGQRRRLPPIHGFEEKPLVSLKETVKPLETLVPQVDQMVWTIQDSCTQPKDGLSPDESASIMLYTLEWAPPEASFYFILNTALRSEDRRKLTPWFLYLRLVIHSLSKLPCSSPKVIFRGVKLDLSGEYAEDKEFFWWPFSSCAASIGRLETHIGQTGARTIYNIQCRLAIDISRHSYYPIEKEYLLYPARQFKFKSILNSGNGLHIIDVEETEPPFPLFQIPSVNKSSPTPPATDQFINILFIGEKGVGKSTFINAFVNYLTSRTVERAQSNKPNVVKPLSFVMTINDSFETRTVSFGDFDHHNPSLTERCETYTVDLNQNDQRKLCLIDTPSLDNSNKIKHILEYVNNLTHLNAVCFLLKPEASELLNSFQSCFAQLMNRLGTNARQNVIFCFTNTLMAFSSPGSTAPLLRNMFASCSMNNIPFSKTNTFGFDNESFRYLVAVKNGIRFNSEDKAEYTMSWSESVKESNRLLEYIRTQLNPCLIVKK
jgi:GTPase SAR1 family protein